MGLKLLRWWKKNYYVCHCMKYNVHESNIDVSTTHLVVPSTKSGNNRQSQLTRQMSLEVCARSFDKKKNSWNSFFSIRRSAPFKLSLPFNLSLQLYCCRVVSLNFHLLESKPNLFRTLYVPILLYKLWMKMKFEWR